MDKATFNVGSSAIVNNLTWNANGTLQQLAIVDPLNSADAQTCTYSYDDLQRILTDNCGSKWGQTFSYGSDPFGSVTKTGSSSWTPGYDPATNRYLVTGSIAYDANGRLTRDPFDSPIGWDIDGNLITQSTTNIAYDGLDRSAGSVINNVWTNYFFAPDGSLMGTVDNWGHIAKMFVPLPMSTAVYSGGALQHYRRNDWQGSVRVASTPSKTAYSITAYGAFGEGYGASGSPNKQFAGLTSDISSGTEQVSLSRRYHPGQGRWISPDGIIPNKFNPQTFNAYHYAFNRPNSTVDPTGMHEFNDAVTPNGGCMVCIPIYVNYGQTIMGNTFFDALAGAPGTYLYTNQYNQTSFGFSEDKWVQAENFMDQGKANLQAQAANLASGAGKRLQWDPNPILTVYVRDFGVSSITSGLIPDYLQLLSDKQQIMSQMTQKEQAYFLAGQVAPSLLDSTNPRAVYISGLLVNYGSAIDNYSAEFNAVYGVKTVPIQ
jgi:RHS repeat-associated protein